MTKDKYYDTHFKSNCITFISLVRNHVVLNFMLICIIVYVQSLQFNLFSKTRKRIDSYANKAKLLLNTIVLLLKPLHPISNYFNALLYFDKNEAKLYHNKTK